MDEKEREESKKYSIVEGSASNVVVGSGDNYIIPYAIKLGASNAEVGVLTAVPSFIGSLFQVVGAKLANKLHNRKNIVTWFILLQALTFIPLFFVPLFTKNITYLMVIFCLYNVFANIVGPPWSSWMGDLVQENQRAKYFSLRNKITTAALFISTLISGIILTYYENSDIWFGFGILFAIAFMGRLISWYYLLKQYEPPYDIKERSTLSFREFLKKIPRTDFGNFVIFRSGIGFAIMVGSPMFYVYMLNYLKLDYLQFTVLTLVPIVAKVITATYWGKYVDRFGTKRVMFVSVFLVSTIPLWWFVSAAFIPVPFAFYFLIFSELLTGFAWAGFDLTTFNYMLETVVPEHRADAFSYFNVIFGFAMVIGGLIGSFLAKTLDGVILFGSTIGVILLLFLLSCILRASVSFAFLHKLHEVRVHRKYDETKIFFDIVLAKPFNHTFHAATATVMHAEESMEKAAAPVIQREERYRQGVVSSALFPTVNTAGKNKHKNSRIKQKSGARKRVKKHN